MAFESIFELNDFIQNLVFEPLLQNELKSKLDFWVIFELKPLVRMEHFDVSNDERLDTHPFMKLYSIILSSNRLAFDMLVRHILLEKLKALYSFCLIWVCKFGTRTYLLWLSARTWGRFKRLMVSSPLSLKL